MTSFQHTAVVTEQGIANICGWDSQAQAQHLIDEAAHPSVRDELWEEADALDLGGLRRAGAKALSRQA